MVGITLTPQQIQAAPPEVRRWLEQELAASFGLQMRASEPVPVGAKHLVACSVEEVEAVLASLRGMLPVVNVFLELGREGASTAQPGIEALRLVDVLRHTRLQSVDQIVACLHIINDTVRRLWDNPNVSLCVLAQNHCLIATPTRQSIHHVWEQLIEQHNLQNTLRQNAMEEPASASPAPSQFSAMTGSIPQNSVHLGNSLPCQ